MTGIDGRVNNLNADVFGALQSIRSRNSGSLTEADARQLSQAIKKDGTIDAAEQDLLTELTQSNVRAITISSAQSPANSVTFGTTSGRTRQVLQETQTPTAQLRALAQQGGNGIRELTKIYQRSPADAERVVNVLASQGMSAWEQSSVGNAYGPLRGMISAAYSGVSQLEGQDNSDARNMLHKAMNQIDRANNDAVPDFLYNWIRPGGYL